MSETITVTEVTGPNERGWYEFVLDGDDRVPTSRSKEIAQQAMTKRGQAVPAVINVTKRGQFTNTYLNEYDGISDKPTGRPASNGGSTSAGARRKDDPFQGSPWAHGRAVELLIGSGADYTFPLDQQTKDHLSATAEWLFDSARKLAEIKSK